MAKIYCCCKEVEPMTCIRCGKAKKLGAFEKVEISTWPRIRFINKPLIRGGIG